ncbi:TPA: helix-turn-helix transcriptional regulator [Streptococcus pyogenes]|uniref:helix-turn-helix domain-containing protein n=1 Tax=Streptococcus pyogenes TaxID=1314 RepID=UPI0027DF254C|nr:AraC family transcriptional regulator [Streptococcus pyogenes]MDQ6183146.1 AraC family transcriptional regulator [Streptococcus pyogenes]HEP2885272.1 helix-turn-helix transcriptional regulator [Streptococcus pyogenes]HEP3064482.1 helix-turn-helix transcriptional regulator [Streptococcus pyogenes]HEP4054264.1 helix-turn-helix transcriptional regulator [Streptococcus pyogenes]HEP4170687.1 helix-turn-helix transcriptional regulator [Streptococcus pyogenes]
MTYYDFVKEYMNVDECKNNKKYSSAGHTFCWSKDDSIYAEGLYWFYEGDGFIIDVHDFYIKEEVIQNSTYSMENYVSICSSYIVSANGEKFNPYQTLTPNSLYTLDFDNIEDDFLFLLHENSYYLTVSVGFKRELLEKHLSSINIDLESFYRALLQTNQIILTKSLEKVAMEILNCKMDAPAADFFFKAKANEWISIVIDTYLNRKKYKIESNDNKALEDVSRFLDDHFAMTVNQETLEKISKMSGTKLKNLFKEKYGQSITEYTQRKRMNVAETLLLNTKLPIKEIAESVGYTSHSKFSIYYKRYKGKLPSEVRNLVCKDHKLKCDYCD